MDNLYKYLPQEVTEYIENSSIKNDITEIRLRKNNLLQFTVNGSIFYSKNIIITQDMLENTFYLLCDKSINVYDEEISQGFITLSCGHRVGIGAEYYYNNLLKKYLLKELCSLNIRISRNNTYFENQEILLQNITESALIIGTPHSGKTTLLKIISEHLSKKYYLVICDERGEIYNININADVIKMIDKPTAISMATRTLNPQFIICDEIGAKEEAEKILSSVNTGVKFICTAHGESYEQIKKRPNIKILLDNNVFKIVVVLENKNKKFFIKEILYV